MLSNIGTTLVVFTLFISFFIINASFVDLKNTNKYDFLLKLFDQAEIINEVATD